MNFIFTSITFVQTPKLILKCNKINCEKLQRLLKLSSLVKLCVIVQWIKVLEKGLNIKIDLFIIRKNLTC